jgi:ankyrin repeat protein
MPDQNGYTPLHWACLSGSYQAVRYLLSHKADVNSKTSSNEATPLILALRDMEETREPRIIHKLLLYGADTQLKVSSSWL